MVVCLEATQTEKGGNIALPAVRRLLTMVRTQHKKGRLKNDVMFVAVDDKTIDNN